MHWKLKALAFRALANMPASHTLHYWLQRNVTRTLPRPQHTYTGIRQLAECFAALIAAHGEKALAECDLLEFGAGRDLALSLAMRACGVRRVVAVDVVPLAKLDFIRTALVRIPVDIPLPRSLVELEASGVEYHAPLDMRRSGFPAGAFDCVMSSEVLEHIPAEDVQTILQEVYRILRPGGVAVMQIDYTDHYARGDGRVSRFNFLRYADSEWAKYNNSFQYVNRFRHADFRRMFTACGFTLMHEAPRHVEASDELVRNLAERFKAYPREELFVETAVIVAKKNPAARAHS